MRAFRTGVLVLVVSLSVSLWAQTPTQAPSPQSVVAQVLPEAVPQPARVLRALTWEDLQLGQRIRISRTRGGPFTGTAVRKTDQFVRLDLTLEPDGLPAQIDFPKDTIKGIALVETLTAAQQQGAQERNQAERVRAIEAVRRRYAEILLEEGPPPILSAVAVEPALTERQVWLLTSYPPEFWGPARFRWIRQRWILIGLPPDETESNWIRVYPEWLQAVDALNQVKKWQMENLGPTLLASFPPEEGWGPDRLAQIKKKEAEGVELNEYEQDFMKFYPDWLKAYEARKRLEELPPVKAEPGAQGEEVVPLKPVEQAPLPPAVPLPPPNQTPGGNPPPQQ